MMFFSELPATNTNLQILLFNPLPLLFVYKVSRHTIKKQPSRFWPWAAWILAVFFLCGIFQKYAEGMYILASSLLIRCVWNSIYQNKYLRKTQ